MRTRKAETRFTEEEYDSVIQSVIDDGRYFSPSGRPNLSAYIRDILLRSETNLPSIDGIEILESIYYELSKQGINLNQLIYAINTEHVIAGDKDILCHAVLNKYDSLLDIIHEMIQAMKIIKSEIQSIKNQFKT